SASAHGGTSRSDVLGIEGDHLTWFESPDLAGAELVEPQVAVGSRCDDIERCKIRPKWLCAGRERDHGHDARGGDAANPAGLDLSEPEVAVGARGDVLE